MPAEPRRQGSPAVAPLRAAGEPLLSVAGLTKRYPGVTALDAVDLDVRAGEVHVLVGENGAGKSTLARCLSGIVRPDAGTMRLGGERHDPAGAADALRAGIQVVHQEYTLMPYLSVAENLFLQRLPRTLGVVRRRALDRAARELLDRVGLTVSPRTTVDRLGIAQMQLVEIAKALSIGCRLLIMDEPTATLTPREASRLFGILRQLTAEGVAIVYISHHLEEIFEIGDRVTVLRNGRRVATHPLAEVTAGDLVQLMVGRDLEHEYPPVRPRAPGDELLRVEGLRVTPASPPVSFAVRAGEIVGVAGLVGSGRTETMRAIFGADRPAAGAIAIRGRPVRITHPRGAVRRGISFLTEDRKGQGLVLDLPIAANLSLASIDQVSRLGLLNRRGEAALASRLASQLRIKSTGIRQHPRALSGGNQQKVVLGRWLAADSDVLIVDEPTRGIDVGARYEIHQLLIDLAAGGKGLLVVSSDLPELLGICDRLLVFSRGRIAGELQRDEFDAERVLTLAYSEYLEGAAEEGDAA
jgi:ribose transport system ATP-binding protein